MFHNGKIRCLGNLFYLVPVLLKFSTRMATLDSSLLYIWRNFWNLFQDFIWDWILGMTLLHVKFQILTYFSWRHLSVRSSFYCFIWYGIPRGVNRKKLKIYSRPVFGLYWYLFKLMGTCGDPLWLLKVTIFVYGWHISVSIWYEFQDDICIISQDIKC